MGEYHSMDGVDMIRNLFLGSFDKPESKTEFYKTYWLPLERMYQTTGIVVVNNNKNKNKINSNRKDNNANNTEEEEEEERSMKMIFEAFLTDETSKLDEARQQKLAALSKKIQNDVI